MLILMLTTQFNAFLMLFFWLYSFKKMPQADQRVLSGAKPALLCLPWVRQKVVWHSTHHHDDPAAYHVEEDAATEKIFLLNV